MDKITMGEHYGITLSTLCKLMEYTGRDGMIEINKLGGVEEICGKLGTSPSQGLGNSIEHRRVTFGSNIVPTQSKATFFKLLRNAMCDEFLIILLLISLLGFLRFVFILKLVCVVVVVLVTTTVNYLKEKQFQSFFDVTVKREVTVVRNAVTLNIVADDVVVGDVCIINNHNFVVADGILLESNDLKVDESSINGSSGYSKKSSHLDPLLLCGSEVVHGSGIMVVTAVGANTRKGIISSMLTKECSTNRKSSQSSTACDHELISFDEDITILHQKLKRMFRIIIYIFLIIAGLIFVALMYRIGWIRHFLLSLIEFFVESFAILSVELPEEIPLTIVIVLAITMKKLYLNNILVRRIYSCETMGNATSICFDKTGTLTTNKMDVVQSYICQCPHTWNAQQGIQTLPNDIINLIAENISINSSTTSMVTYTSTNDVVQIGNKTECALLNFVQKIGLDFQTIRDTNAKRPLIHVFPFNSHRKLMATVIPLSNGGYRLFVKGATELVLSKCKFIFGQNGKLMESTNDLHERLLLEVVKPITSNRLRTISLAYRDFVTIKTAVNESPLNGEPDWTDEINILNNLTCLCVLGIDDPVRSDVSDTIRNLKTAGITVRMVTGDDINTAKSVALQCGIIETNGENQSMDATEFNRLIRDNDGVIQQHLFDEVYPDLRVIARASPTDKYNLVNGIIKSKISIAREVVAMVGNGDGDALALKKADVGITFNQFGTDVAKQASDIILLDDKFDSIMKPLLWGRNSYDSIAKFVQFRLCFKLVLLTMYAFEATFLRYLSYAFSLDFWVHCILNILTVSPVFLTHNPTNELLHNKPHARNEPFISKIMVKNIVGQSIYTLVVIFILNLFYVGRMGFDEDYFVYKAFILITLFNMFNIFDGILLNIHSGFTWIATSIGYVLAIRCLQGKSLSPVQWLWCVLLGIGILLWQQVLLVCIKQRTVKVTSSAV